MSWALRDTGTEKTDHRPEGQVVFGVVEQAVDDGDIEDVEHELVLRKDAAWAPSPVLSLLWSTVEQEHQAVIRKTWQEGAHQAFQKTCRGQQKKSDPACQKILVDFLRPISLELSAPRGGVMTDLFF